MFFSINRAPQTNFNHHWNLGSFVVSTDSGWQSRELGNHVVLFKGYADNARLDEIVEDIIAEGEPTTLGNFCIIDYNTVSGTLALFSDRCRSFPIYYNNTSVTNLIPLENTVWTNNLLSIDKDFCPVIRKFNLIGRISSSAVSSIDDIDNLIATKICNWAEHNRLPIKVFLSGGVDSLLVYSYIRRLGIAHTLVWATHIDHDAFWLANHGDLSKLWGYTQIHHWTDPCVLASGTPGDEFMLRGPTVTNWYLMQHGTSILQLLVENKDCLHREYFSMPKNRDALAKSMTGYIQEKSADILYWKICNNVLNDWQHWHLGNTITFTPLRDLELIKLFLQLPFELAKGQIMDSVVSRELIERNVPGLSAVISDQKNTGNYMSNLRQLLV